MRKYIFPLLAGLLMTHAALADGFRVTSAEVKAGKKIADEQVFNSFGCTGGNVSPALGWKDAPTGSGWWHWVVFNIPADATGLAKGAGDPKAKTLPAGSVQSRTDFGQPGYGGPCPPQGDKAHRYQFTVYALKVDKLPLDANASAAMVGFYLHQNQIKHAMLQAHYGR